VALFEDILSGVRARSIDVRSFSSLCADPRARSAVGYAMWLVSEKIRQWRLTHWVTPQFVASIVAAVPFLALVISINNHTQRWQLAAFAVWIFVIYGMIEFPEIVWSKFRRAASDIDSMVASTPEKNRHDVLSSLGRSCRFLPQSLFLLAGGPVLMLLVWIAHAEHNYSNVPQDVMIPLQLIVGALGAHSIYWIIQVIKLTRGITHLPNLSLWWLTPISTPGLEELASVCKTGALLGLSLIVGYGIPLSITFAVHGSLQQLLLFATAGIAGLSCVISVGAVCLGWLANVANLAKRQGIAELLWPLGQSARSQREISGPSMYSITDTQNRLSALMLLQNSADSYIGAASIAQYLASVLAVVLQFAIAALLSHH
jgi:hypothetical protein